MSGVCLTCGHLFLVSRHAFLPEMGGRLSPLRDTRKRSLNSSGTTRTRGGDVAPLGAACELFCEGQRSSRSRQARIYLISKALIFRCAWSALYEGRGQVKVGDCRFLPCRIRRRMFLIVRAVSTTARSRTRPRAGTFRSAPRTR